MARQSGKSTATTAFILWYVLFNDAKTVGILANKEENADLYNELIPLIKNKKWHELRKWVGENSYLTNDLLTFSKNLEKYLEPLINPTSMPLLIVRRNEFDVQNHLCLDKELNVLALLVKLMNELVFNK